MNNRISELLNLNDKTALVTGGATGIGASIAETLAAAGARVVIADINLEGANLVSSKIGGHAIETDVTDPASAESAVNFSQMPNGQVRLSDRTTVKFGALRIAF